MAEPVRPNRSVYPGLGRRIHSLLAHRQQSQLWLAEASGLSRQTLSILMRDRATPDVLERVAGALGLTAAELTGADLVIPVEGGGRIVISGGPTGLEAPAAHRPPDPAGISRELSPGARIFLHRLLLELAEEGASDFELDWAKKTLTRPDNYTYSYDGTRRDYTPEEELMEMEGMALGIRGVIKRRRELGRR